METNKKNGILVNMLSIMLNCGVNDIDFLINELENFNVEFDTVNDCEFNNVIDNIYRVALNKAKNSVNNYFEEDSEIDEEMKENCFECLQNIDEKIETYCNYGCSSIYFNGDEVYSYEDLKDEILHYVLEKS